MEISGVEGQLPAGDVRILPVNGNLHAHLAGGEEIALKLPLGLLAQHKAPPRGCPHCWRSGAPR